ncbi:1921_t:CDS:10, partial [Acaulospora colombiana]
DKKSAGEWIMKVTKDLLSHDASLSSVPLLITFLKAYGRPFLGLHTNTGQDTGPEDESEELIDKEIRDRFKRMCEGYYENVAKILVKEHKASRASSIVRTDRNLIISVYKNKINATMKPISGERQRGDDLDNMGVGSGSQWEDEEERKFYEDIIDLKDWVPRSFLNIQDGETESVPQEQVDTETSDIDRLMEGTDEPEEGTEYGFSEPESRPVSPSTNGDPVVAPGPSQVLTGIMGKLPEATSRDAIDQVAVDFIYVNSKAARKRLVKFLVTSPKQRTDLIPYYGRLVATISKYAPDLAKETLVAEGRKGACKFKSEVFLDDLTGTNVDGLAALLEGCGRFLLRGADTGEKTASMASSSYTLQNVFQAVEIGMEQNLYKQNQKRIATVKYLGELYIYRLVNSRVIFDTLWSLVTFGHHEGRPLPGQISPIDAPDDFFRIRLVCTLLDACGMCFDRGSYKRKLDRFLTFFQNDLPMDVDFMLTDTMEQLRPKMSLFKTFEEAAAVVDEMFESIKVDADDSGDESGDDDERPEVEENEENNVDDEVSDRPNSPDHLDASRPSQGPTEEEAADFDKEFSKMLSDAAADSKKVDKRAVLSAWETGVAMSGGLARRKKERQDEPQAPSDMMRFTVLSKKANKNPTRELEIPTSSAIAAHTLSAQMESKQEQEQLKRLVLDYEHREELAEMRDVGWAARNLFQSLYLFIEKVTSTALTRYKSTSATIEGEIIEQEGDKHVNDPNATRIYKQVRHQHTVVNDDKLKVDLESALVQPVPFISASDANVKGGFLMGRGGR